MGFAIRREADPSERSEHILALNKNGVHFLDVMTHETLLHYPFAEVISTRKVKSEDGILFLDMKCGNLMQHDTHSDGSGSRDFSFDSPVHHHPAAWTKQRGGACLVSMNMPCSFIIRIYLILIFSIDVLIFLPSSRL